MFNNLTEEELAMLPVPNEGQQYVSVLVAPKEVLLDVSKLYDEILNIVSDACHNRGVDSVEAAINLSNLDKEIVGRIDVSYQNGVIYPKKIHRFAPWY